MDVVAIHIDSTDMQFHSSPSNRIAAGIPESQVSRMVWYGVNVVVRFLWLLLRCQEREWGNR